MGPLRKILRTLIGITMLFIVMSAAFVAGVVLLHLQQWGKEAQAAKRELVERQLKIDYGSLAEESYLGLDTLRLRQRKLQESLGEYGSLTLKIEPRRWQATRSSSRPADAAAWMPMERADGDTLRMPLVFGEHGLGEVIAEVRWTGTLDRASSRSLFLSLAGMAALMAFGWLGLFLVLIRKVYQPLLRGVVELQREAAIAQTTQMLAHDIRKPFSLLRMALQLLEDVSDPSHMRRTVRKLVPEVQRSMASVDGMLADIMEIGATSGRGSDVISPVSLIAAALTDVFRVRRSSDIGLSYTLGHTRDVAIDGARVLRVMTNIIENAAQAMGDHGQLWVLTRDVQSATARFVEFTIGNSGSFIPPVERARVFEAFFTKGKRGGTGLGLAIAHKIVTAHGGRIWCTSAEDTGTEFIFTLPASAGLSSPAPTALPSHVRAFAAALVDAEDNEEGLEVKLRAVIRDLGRPLVVLLIDDEPIYVSAMRAQLERNPDLVPAFRVMTAASGPAALTLVASTAPDVVICDIDMGSGNPDGFAVTRELRAARVVGRICLHSNRGLPGDAAAATAAGADDYVVKPMRRDRLLGLLIQAMAGKIPAGPSAEAPLPSRDASRPEIALVDDSIFIRETWALAVTDARLHAFASPAEFWRHARANPGFLAHIALIVTDYQFDDAQDGIDGIAFAREVRRAHPPLPIILSSDAILAPEALDGAVDAVIGKEPRPFASLIARVRNKRLKAG